MRALAALAVALIVVIALGRLGAPRSLDPAIARAMEAPGDAKAGEIVFWTAGCSSCHAARDTPTRLGGGAALATPFGSITPPNISPDAQDGVGGWSAADFAHALYDGVAPHGQPLYPAFPYPSYRHIALADARDLWAFLRTLPPVKGRAPPPALRFPYNLRAALGFWQRLFLPPLAPPEAVAADDGAAYGRYLVEGAGHCGECHTPRGFLGETLPGRALSGAPSPDGDGKTPNITPAGLAKWSEDDLEAALLTGLTPDGDSLGGAMAEVVRNLSHLPKADVKAIARYLKAGG